jgi:hypothetical protein
MKRCGRAALLTLAALLLNLSAAFSTAAHAATVVAQGQVTNTPLAPPFVFILLLAALFLAVLVFSWMAFRDAGGR